jgi:hypothetical protein
MLFSIQVARPTVRPAVRLTIPAAVCITVQAILNPVILTTSDSLYKMMQSEAAAISVAALGSQTTSALAELRDSAIQISEVQDIQPLRPIRRLELTLLAKEVQPLRPIQRISLPADPAKDIQPVELLRQIDLT